MASKGAHPRCLSGDRRRILLENLPLANFVPPRPPRDIAPARSRDRNPQGIVTPHTSIGRNPRGIVTRERAAVTIPGTATNAWNHPGI